MALNASEEHWNPRQEKVLKRVLSECEEPWKKRAKAVNLST